ncbi:SUMF1/EgtB/PvdO family nonheme iron enzyme [Nostoc sp. CHAB 5836]|nr:SUMF1/EgtB/PvdO family nonheme iron enzyme [Nostoc sp. CHAB 5836]
MLSQSSQVHVAEVLLGGLVELKSQTKIVLDTNPNEVEYQFIDGVDEILLDSLPATDKAIVKFNLLEELTEHITDRIGLSIDIFAGFLQDPRQIGSITQQPNPIASLAIQKLKKLGGEYAHFAKKLEDSLNPLDFKSVAGEYACAVKWGGETGTWQKESEPEHLLISEQGEVQFRSRFGLAAIQNLTVQGQTLSWSFDHNQTAASITFKENSEDSYFWSEKQTGKLFEGWLNYPNEGRIDFRGRFVISDDFPPIQEFIFEVATITLQPEIQPFEFEVAIIELERKWSSLGRKAPVIKRSRQQVQYFIEDLGNGVQLEMVSIPEGSFIMGSPEDEPERSSSESPQHQVTVLPFFMGKYSVTQAQWQAVASLRQVNRELNPDPSRFKGANRPVEQVSWYDAVEFCSRLSQYTKRQYRLPSEAEWEYACRAGTTTPFHFGETITSELANYRANEVYGAGVKGRYRQQTTPVGSFKVANAFGLYDMHGNVWEWCLDHWHGNYEDAPTDGSPWFDEKNDNFSQKHRITVLRGGSWYDLAGNCRSASRDDDYTRDNHDDVIGFRVVCAVGRIL